jgi:S-adenosylmethionine:tRNA ribosyltransferase-isomerase
VRLNIKSFQYQLPDDRIALFPLADRDKSKLLIFRHGKISHSQFFQIAEALPENSFLFFNNTRVIPARLHFRKSTGADIEIFLLNPVEPSSIVGEAMLSKGKCKWQCTIGNLKRWNDSLTLVKQQNGITLEANLTDRSASTVEFSWDPPHSFAHVVDVVGETPLPPYLHREPQASDKETYQTVYSKHEGAVAAPTAGLHFTDAVFKSLLHKNIQHDFLTLHVSAGTFQPIKTQDAEEHIMHGEQMIITKQNIENLLLPDRFVTAVGTTSMRTIESLYWFGVKLLVNSNSPFKIAQNDPYILPHHFTATESLDAILKSMTSRGLNTLIGETSIYIKPGYKFRICKALITNFHQPGSTLILLIAAFIGDYWKEIYRQALENNYRFLSYGDSSLLIP